MEKSIRDKKSELEKFISNGTLAKDSLKELVDLAEKAEKKRKELSDLLDNLENELNAGKCSSELKAGLTEQKNNNGKTYIGSCWAMTSSPWPRPCRVMTSHN